MKISTAILILAFAGFAGSALTLAGCGDTCSSKAADVAAVGSCTSLAADSDVTIEVQVCATCSDTSPSCKGEVVNGEIQLDASFKECQANSSCAASACNTGKVSCTVHTPPATASADIVTQNKGSTNRKTVSVAAGGPTTCAL
jgi:hypothetical protein